MLSKIKVAELQTIVGGGLLSMSAVPLVSSILSNRFISVVADATSASFTVFSGVPHGSVLSPTLFFSL